MKNVTNIALALTFALVGLGTAVSHAEPPDKAARDAAAAKCGMPKRGEGKPTAEQEACMTAAGFPKPKHGPHGGPHGGHHGPPPTEDPSTAPGAAEAGSAE